MESNTALVKRLIEGYRNTALVTAAVQAGLFDALADNPGRPDGLSMQEKRHLPTVERVLRGLVLLGLVTETSEPGGTVGYRLTDAGQLLRHAVSRPGKPLLTPDAGTIHRTWMGLDTALVCGNTPFVEVFGESVWSYRRSNADAGAVFDRWLHRLSSDQFDGFAEAYDFSSGFHGG